MHGHANSLDSTPFTAKSSNLSSVLEANPVVQSLNEQFVDMNTPDRLRLGVTPTDSDIEEKSAVTPLTDIDAAELANPKEVPPAMSPTPLDPIPEHHTRTLTAESAASIIQKNWVNSTYKKKKSKTKNADDHKDDVSVASYESKLHGQREDVDLNLPEDMLLYANLTRASYVFESPLSRFLQEPTGDVEIAAANEDLDLKEPWIAPSVEFAISTSNHIHPRKNAPGLPMYDIKKTTTGRHCQYKECGEQCDLFHEGSFSEFGQFGPGITNYFKFLKWCFWIFVTLSVLYLPKLIFAVNGDRGLRNMGKLTLGNIAPFNNTEYTLIPECEVSEGWTCRVKMENVGIMWESIDIAACILVLVGFVWLRFFEKSEIALLNKCSISPSDYTVLVSNLPPNCTEIDIKVYFARLMAEAVSEIVFVYDDEECIETFQNRGALIKKRNRLTQEYRYHNSFVLAAENRAQSRPVTPVQKTIPVGSFTKEYQQGKISRKGLLIQISKERRAVTAQLKVLDRRFSKENREDKPLHQAYVTFHSHEGKRKALKLHKYSLYSILRPNPKLNIKGYRPRLSVAPDPEKIIWENVRYSTVQRLGRQFLTFCLAFTLVAVCVVMISITLGYDVDAAEAGGTDQCPAGFRSWSSSAKAAAVNNNPGILHCYCDEYKTNAGDVDGCKRYYASLTVARLFRGATAVTCCLCAVLCDGLLFSAQSFEKHLSTDGADHSIMWRSLIIKIIIYGLLFIFNAGYVSNSLEYTGPELDSVFTPFWFNSTGQALFLTMGLNIFTPHLYRLFTYIKFVLKQKAVESKKLLMLTQDEMNNIYRGPDFVLGHRYSQLVATFIVLFMYLTSFPIFAIVGMLSFCVAYCIDKFLFVRYYLSPTRYPYSLGKRATALIPYGVIAHLVLALWAVGKAAVFETQHSESKYGMSVYNFLNIRRIDPDGFLEKLIGQKHTVYLGLLLIVLILMLIVKWIVHHFLFAGNRITELLCFEFLSKYDFFFSPKQFRSKILAISYPRAIRRGYIKGLDNYNIVHNQKYKDAFVVDDQLINEHRRLRSLLVGAITPKNLATPKPLPENDPISGKAMEMFELYGGNSKNTKNQDESMLVPTSNPGKKKAKKTPGSEQGHLRHKNGGIPHANTSGNLAMEREDLVFSHDMPFHVVQNVNGSRLVSDSYNVKIRDDGVPRQFSDGLIKKKVSEISELSSSDAADSEVLGSRIQEPVVYATLSRKLLESRAEPPEVVQARVLRRFESEGQKKVNNRAEFTDSVSHGKANQLEPVENAKHQKFKKEDPFVEDHSRPIFEPREEIVRRASDGQEEVPFEDQTRAVRALLRQASEELVSAPKPKKAQERPIQVPNIGNTAGTANFLKAIATGSYEKDVFPSPRSGFSPVGLDGSGNTPRLQSGIPTPRLGSESVIDTPRAVAGTPRVQDSFEMLSPRNAEIEMPPPNKVVRGGGGRRKKSDVIKEKSVPDDELAIVPVPSTAVNLSSDTIDGTENRNKSPRPSPFRDTKPIGDEDPPANSPEHYKINSASALNARRAISVTGPSPDILRQRNTMSARRRSLDKDGVEHHVRQGSHSRQLSNDSSADPSKKFVPKSLGSFGDKSQASIRERASVLPSKEAAVDSDDDSLSGLSPVNISPVRAESRASQRNHQEEPVVENTSHTVTEKGERDIVGDLRRRLLGAGSSANSAEGFSNSVSKVKNSDIVAAASSDGEDFPATPRIRIANNAPSLMSMSAPNSGEKGRGSFDVSGRTQEETNVASDISNHLIASAVADPVAGSDLGGY